MEPILNQSVLEHRIKICHSPHILHIATHGFFFPSQVQQISESDHKASFSGAQFDGINKSISPLQNSDNPMLRCGLALAGANTRLLNGALPADAEDRNLTAQDVSTMDLSCTELAVLSACDTGLGTILTGEGVFGLRRAFAIAGAQTLVMSSVEGRR